MKILFVVNNFYIKGNGLSASARRTVEYLKKHGQDVKVLSCRSPYNDGIEPDFVLNTTYIPLFNNLIKHQGYEFAKAEKDVIKEAVAWADVVHLEEPFYLQIVTAKVAEELGKPITSTYHLHPENLFASIGLEKSKHINQVTLRVWRDTVFNKSVIIQSPTENAKKRLVDNGFTPEIRVISNGLLIEDEGKNLKKTFDGYYNIASIGRLSREKDEMTLIKAMKYSKYAKQIRLIFAGRGPLENNLKKLAYKYYIKKIISVYPIFGFYSIGELQNIAKNSHLYIHCASIEVEGLSCLEAIQTGLVPIIADAKYSATTQFALRKENTFPAHNERELAKRIDFWLDNEILRKSEEQKYKKLKDEYDINKSIEKLIEMFEDAISLYNAKNKA